MPRPSRKHPPPRVVAKDELDAMLNNAQLRVRVPLLVLANKQDLPAAMQAVEIATVLRLAELPRAWQIVATNALTGEGVDRGLEWLAQSVKRGW